MSLTQLSVAAIVLDESSIDKCLDRLKDGLVKYLWIQNNFININVSQDDEFQRKFNHFYRVRRNTQWRKFYFQLFENCKNNPPSFEFILEYLSSHTGRIEASFSSKLVATLNPEMPVIDSVVLRNLGLKLPTASKDRLQKVAAIYEELGFRLDALLKSENGAQAILKFKDRYPGVQITNIKILDLILWQLRGNNYHLVS